MFYTPKAIIQIIKELLTSGKGAELTETRKYIEGRK